MEKTKYRLICDGHTWYVQYFKVVIKKFLFWKIDRSAWNYIEYPHYHKVTRDDGGSTKGYVSTDSDYGYRYTKEYLIDSFEKDYPDISVYFRWYQKRQNELIGISNKWWIEHNSKTGKIIERN